MRRSGTASTPVAHETHGSNACSGERYRKSAHAALNGGACAMLAVGRRSDGESDGAVHGDHHRIEGARRSLSQPSSQPCTALTCTAWSSCAFAQLLSCLVRRARAGRVVIVPAAARAYVCGPYATMRACVCVVMCAIVTHGVTVLRGCCARMWCSWRVVLLAEGGPATLSTLFPTLPLIDERAGCFWRSARTARDGRAMRETAKT